MNYIKMFKRVSRFIQIFFLLFSSVGVFNVYGQVYPVQVTTQVVPPYTPYLSDYTAPGSQRLMVNFVMRDPTLSEYSCKLRITIEGVGITIRTKPSFIPPALVLPGGGVPLMLTGEDLMDYFKPDNLDFAGISRGQYEKGAKLPEGVYRFTVEVLDYNRNTLVSNKGTATAWIILNDPPLLNLPRMDTKAQILDPTNIPFTWTPRHTGSPNAAFTTEYVFRMVEIWPVNRNPYDAFLSQPALYEVTTNLPQIIYGPAEPALLPGRKYAWQVQARDVEGRDLFKNDGKSEVYVFQFGDALGIPEALTLQSSTSSALTVRWDQPTAGTDAVTYRTRYRPHTNRKHDNWYEGTTGDQWKMLSSLQPNTEYEVQVRAEQTMQTSDYSNTAVFKTAVAGASDFACKSDVTPPPAPASTTPAFPLGINDTIHAGGYDVLVRGLTASGKTYTGDGFAIVPWLAGAKIRVTFKDISVNGQFWLTSGEIKSVWNADSKFLINVPTKENPKNTPNTGEIPVTVVGTDTTVIIKDGAIATVTKDPEGNIVVETTDGKTTVLEKGKSYSIADEIGNGYVVDKEGNITKTTSDQALAAAERGNRDYNIALRFEKPEKGKFGFDAKKYEPLNAYYQQLDAGDYIAWKAVTSSESDDVNAIITGDLKRNKLKFEISGAPVMPSGTTGDLIPLSVRGKAEGTVEELLAMYPSAADTTKPQVVGKLNLISYDKISRNVVIVPVNDARLPGGVTESSIQTELNRIYGQAVTEWKVSMATRPLEVTLDGAFDDGHTGLLSNYTSDMRTVISAYGSLQNNTYYLFLVNNPKSGAAKYGYMPRSKQAGFIFISNLNSSDAATTMAHELGHGAFNLQHTFDEFPGLTQTDNVMDYPNGTALYKYQWDHVHNPQRVIGLFEGDDAGASIAQSKVACVNDEILGKFSGNVFYDPSGKVINLGKGVPLSFYSTKEADAKLRGRLAAFTLNGVLYRTYHYTDNLRFAGYAPDDAKYKTIDEFLKLVHNPTDGIKTNVQKLEIDENCAYRILKNGQEIGKGSLASCECGYNKSKGSGPSGGATGIPTGLAGGFYRHHEPTANIDKAALLRVANLISKMGDDFYKEYLPDAETVKLNNANLAAMEKALQQFIDIQNEVFGETSFAAFKQILEFLKLCAADYKLQLADDTHDIVPRCIWKNQTETLYYTAADLAFNSGIIDGAWGFVMGAMDLIHFVDCWIPSPSLKFWLDESCGTTRTKTKQFFSSMKTVISDKTKRNAMGDHLGNEFQGYLHSLSGFSPDNRHEQGKLVFDIASLFFGVGEANAALKGANLAEKSAVMLERVTAVLSKIKIPPIIKAIPTRLTTGAKTAALALTLTVGTVTADVATVIPKAGHAIEYVVKVGEVLTENSAKLTKAVEEAQRVVKVLDATQKGVVTIVDKAGKPVTTIANAAFHTVDVGDFVILAARKGTNLDFEAINAIDKQTGAVMLLLGAAGGAGAGAAGQSPPPCPLCQPRTANDALLCTSLQAAVNNGLTDAAMKKLCAVSQIDLTNVELKSIAMLIGSVFSKDEAIAFSNDIVEVSTSQASLSYNAKKLNSSLTNTWLFLYRNHTDHAPFTRKYFTGLERFKNLNENVKVNIVKFSDDKANSTLKTFTDALDASATGSFTKFINDNPQFSEGFVGHKLKPMMDVDQYDQLREEMNDKPLAETLKAKIADHLDRSSDIARQRRYCDLGREFEEYVASELRNAPNPTYNGVAGKIDNLDTWTILYHAYFCIRKPEGITNAKNGGVSGDCVTEGTYFVADFAFVRPIKDAVGNTGEFEVVIADSKLSPKTDFTPNQKEAIKKNSFVVRTTGERLNGLELSGYNRGTVVQRAKKNGVRAGFIKIFSNGNKTYGGVEQK